jgi:hypothetical protein
MVKYLKEDYNVSDCNRIIKDAREQLSDMTDTLDWAEIECEDIKNGELDYYGEQTLSRYTKSIYRALYNLSKALSACSSDFRKIDINDM